MEKVFEIEDRKNIIRDANSKALLKTNITEKDAWLKKKERNNKIIQNENEIYKMKEELSDIKIIVNEIKNILKVNN